MSSFRPLVLALALAMPGGVAVLATATPAWAQSGPSVFAAPGLVEVVPAGDVIGDGSSPVTMHVLALKPDGTPMTGLRLKPSASLGSVEGWTEVRAGVYAFTYTAPAVTSTTSAIIEVKGRTPTRASVDARYKVPVRPPTATGLMATANPPQLVLGQDGEGSVSFVLEGAAGNVTAEDLMVRSSAGELQNLTHLGGGRFTARFVTPRVNYPQLALISVTDLRNPDAVYGALALPLNGKTDYPVQAAPNSSVVLEIGGREYGPVKANAAGSARVPVIVPPGVQGARKLEIRDGKTVEEAIDLRVPETPRLTVVPSRRAIPADGVTAVPVRVAVFTPDGKPDEVANVTFAATGGTVGAARHLGGGIYEASFTPRSSNVAATAQVTASLAGSSVQTDTMELRLVPARPQNVSLRAQPEELVKGATGLRVFAKVLGANGQGLDRRELVMSVTGATIKGGVQDLRNGDYRIDLSAAPGQNVDMVAAVRNPVTGNPLRYVLLFPQVEAAPNDGTSATRLTVVTVDEFGFPVPDTDVQLSIETGDGTIQPSVRTNEGGVGQVYYTSGRGSGLVRVRARSGNRTAMAALLQGPSSLAGVDVPMSGGQTPVALTEAWKGLVVPLRVPREGAGDAISGTTDGAASEAGAIARVSVRSEPGTVAAGGQVTLMIDAKDAQGLGVPGQSFDIIANQGGEPGAVSELGGGKYQVVVRVPPTAVGELKVSVGSGDVATFSKIPISGVAANAGDWGQTSADPVAGNGTGGTTDPVPGPSTGGPTWEEVRVRASYATNSYRYQQAPLPDNGPLLPAIIAVGGENGQKRATPQGVELAAEAWTRYVGMDMEFRASAWSMTADVFTGTVNDGLVQFSLDGRVRYPFVVGDDHFWLGARVGFHTGDILYFTGTFEQGTADFSSLVVWGGTVGGEIGADFGPIRIQGMVGYRTVQVSGLGLIVDGHASYDFTDSLFADVGIGLQEREVIVRGERTGNELGSLSDGLITGRFGLGVRF